MTRTSNRLDAIEAALGRIEPALAAISDALNPLTPGGLAAVIPDLRAAKAAAESSFVATQALASVAAAKPGPAELAAAVQANTEAVRQVHGLILAATQPPVPDPGPAPAGGPGTAGKRR
jgi:hypothetical protein